MVRKTAWTNSSKTVNAVVLAACLGVMLYIPTDMAIAKQAGVDLWLTLLLPLFYACGVFGLIFACSWIYSLMPRDQGTQKFGSTESKNGAE